MRSSHIIAVDSDNRRSTTETKNRLRILTRLVEISFHPIWQWLIEVVIVLSIFNAVYVTFFSTDETNTLLFYYCLEGLFLSDTLIAYFHRFRVLKFSLNPPRRVIILLIDTLSLLPIYECCFIAFPHSATLTFHKRQELKSILRIVHLIAALFLERFYSIKMHIAMLKVTHVFLLLIMNLLLACWWSYEGRCWPQCDAPNWTDSLRYMTELRLSDALIWFLTCFTTLGDVLIHGSPGFLIDHNDTEALIMLAAMIIGFTMHSFFEVAHTCNSYLDLIQTRYDYKFHIRKLHRLFESCASDDRKARTLLYYDMLWKKRKGVVLSEELLHELPTILVKEVMVDAFHEALIHSHLFCNLPYALKKELCICMRTEYYLPGDYLIRPGQSYAHMLYLHSGIVNVISHEDHQTPVLALAGGTLLGETSLCIAHVSKVMMQCATECEVKLLPMPSYIRLALRYHDQFYYVHQRIERRLEFARQRLHHRAGARRAGAATGAGCKRLKKQWRCVAELHAHAAKHGHAPREMWDRLNKTFHSKYLDTIALADRLTADRKIICLTGKCPYVMHPDSSFRKFFTYLHLVVVVIHSLILPYYYVFTDTLPDAIIVVNTVMDAIFFLDIYLQLITYIIQDGIEIMEPKVIVMYKFKQIRFLLDIFSVFPYEYIEIIFFGSHYSYLTLRLPKLIQWYKIIDLVIKVEANSINRSYMMIFLKYFVLYFTAIYLSTCYHYVMFNFGQRGPHPATSDIPIAKLPVLNCILYNLSAICLLGLSERMPISMHGLLMYSLLTFVGCYMLNFCVVEISCNIVKNNEAQYKHLKYMKTVDDFLISNPKLLKYKMFLHDYFGFLWQYNKNVGIIPDVEMPEHDIYLKNIVRQLRQVPAFADFSDKLVELIAARAHVRLHPPGYELSSVDERYIHLHIIAKGYCSMELFMPGDREKNITKILQPGDCFNILEIFHSLNSFNTVKTVTAVEEISICGNDIWDVLNTNPRELANFRKALEWHAAKYETILNVNKLSDFLLPHSGDPTQSSHVPYFKYNIDDNFDFDGGQTRAKKLRKHLGIWYHIMLKDSIDPERKFFIAWEIFRSVIATCFGFMTLLIATVLRGFYLEKNICYIVTLVVFIVDIYIRLHLQYYNEENIKVTYLHKTMEHYVKTSVTLDIIAMTPFVIWPVYFGETYAFSLNVIIAVIYYISLFHRPMQGLKYVETKFSDTRRYLAIALRNTIIVFVVVAIAGNNMLLSVCTYDDVTGYNCRSTVNYISTSPFVNYTSTWHLLLFQLHAVSERIHSDIVGVSEYPLMNNVVESLLINMVLWGFKFYLMSKMIASTIGGNAVILNRAKTRFSNFVSFIKYESVSDETVIEVKEHFEYVNTKYAGFAIAELLWKFPDNVRLDIKNILFSPTLKSTQFFRAFSSKSLRTFLDDLDMRYYKIGADIIRCNDVQRNIYVVSKGAVDIIVAADVLITLTHGGAFGCFNESGLGFTGEIIFIRHSANAHKDTVDSFALVCLWALYTMFAVKRGITRQTIRARSRVHVELLVIDSATFYKHLAPYPSLIEQLRVQMQRNVEYFESAEFSTNVRSTATLTSAHNSKMWMCYKLYAKFNYVVRLSSKSYQRYVLAVVHLAALSSIILICLSFTKNYWMLASFCYICDAFFWANIVIMFHMQYIDPATGKNITSPKLIRKRYTKTLTFWVTLLGTLPIEVIPLIARADKFVVKCFFSNRLLRFALTMIYNNELNKKLSFSKWFQWLYIVYLLTFQIGFMSFIWWTVACNFETCMHRVSDGPQKEMGTTGDRNEILLSVLYIVILFTAAGVRTVSSVTIAQIIVTILISCASLIITSIMIGVLTSLLIIKDNTSNRYKNKVARMKLYFGSLHLSPYLRSRIYESMVMLWMRRRGELLPKIIEEAPGYIRQDLMMSIYGMHLNQHKLFGKMHLDMLRQVCPLLKVGMYTPEQLIVSAGDRDGCMYFLHRGQIQVTDEESGVSFVASELYAFGEEQGIYGRAHRRTYVAYTIIDLLVLEKNVWDYLLEWYPASKEIIAAGFVEYCRQENEVDPRDEINIID